MPHLRNKDDIQKYFTLQKQVILKCQKSAYPKAELPTLSDAFPKLTLYFISYNIAKSLPQTDQIRKKILGLYTHNTFR